MSNSIYEYTLTQDQLQIQAQIAIDELLEQALDDKVIDEDTYKDLAKYILVVQTNRSFSERISKLLGLEKDRANGKLQTVWIASRPRPSI